MVIVLFKVVSQLPIIMDGHPPPLVITRMPQTLLPATQRDMDRPGGVIEAVAAAAADPGRPVILPLVQTGAAVADGLATVSPIVGNVKLPGQPWPLVV